MRNLCIVTAEKINGNIGVVYCGTEYGEALNVFEAVSKLPETKEIAFFRKPSPVKYRRLQNAAQTPEPTKPDELKTESPELAQGSPAEGNQESVESAQTEESTEKKSKKKSQTKK